MKLQASSVLVELVLDLFGDRVGKEDRRLDFAFTSAGRTYLLYLHFDGRSNALARDLHESELTER